MSWRAQNRLHRRFAGSALRGLHRNKVVVAVARELAAFIWELARVLDKGNAGTRGAAESLVGVAESISSEPEEGSERGRGRPLLTL